MMQIKINPNNLDVDKSNCLDLSFDELLVRTWTQAEKNGVLKYSIDNSIRKRSLDGRYSFLCHLNANRLTMKRKAQQIDDVKVVMKKDEFNFTKISENEKLFDFIIDKFYGQERIKGTIIVNNAPIEFCSSLLVLELDRLLPQLFTRQSLLLALYVSSCSNEYLRLGFNSPAAFSSVNHCHWHLYYQNENLLIAKLPIENNQLVGWFLRSLVFELDTDIFEKLDCRIAGNFYDPTPDFVYYLKKMKEIYSEFAIKIEKLIEFITDDLKLAYNLFITKCSTNTKLIRLFIWPRLPAFGLKDDHQINPAICEFSGFFIFKQPEMFENATEQELIELTKAYELDETLFNKILNVKEQIFK